MRASRTLALGTAISILVLCPTALAGSNRAAAGKAAVDFEGSTLSGKKLRLSSLKGKVVLLDFWASWCEPCKKELPRLAQMAKRLRPRGIEIVTVNLDTDKSKAVEFLESHDVQLQVVLDPESKIVGKYDPENMPTSYGIDQEGQIRFVNSGYEDGDEKKIEAKLVELVGPQQQ